MKWVGPFLEFRRRPLAVLGTDDLMFVNQNSVRLFGDLEAEMIGILSSSSEIEYLKFSDVFFKPIKPFIGNCFVFRDTDHYLYLKATDHLIFAPFFCIFSCGGEGRFIPIKSLGQPLHVPFNIFGNSSTCSAIAKGIQ